MVRQRCLVFPRSIHRASIRATEADQNILDTVWYRRACVDGHHRGLGHCLPDEPRRLGSDRRPALLHHTQGHCLDSELTVELVVELVVATDSYTTCRLFNVCTQ